MEIMALWNFIFFLSLQVSVSNVLYPNGIEFKGPFTDKTTGKYTCTVAWYPEGGRSVQKMSGSYDVEVLFYPSVSKKMVPLKYVADGNNGTVKCLFEGKKLCICVWDRQTERENINGIQARSSGEGKLGEPPQFSRVLPKVKAANIQ